MKKVPLYLWLIVFLLLLSGCAFLALGAGVYQFSGGNAYQVLWKLFTQDTSLSVSDRYIIWNVRSARVVMGILVGSMLAFCGTLLQGMFKNPLATSDLIGLNSGATLMASIAIVLGSSFRAYLPEMVSESLVSFSAFFGSLLAMLLVYRISTTGGKTNVLVMLLSGVALTAIGFAFTGFLIYLSKDEQLRDLTFWNLGSLANASWTKNGILAAVLILSYALLMGKGKVLNAMMLGEKDAQHLGINVESVKRKIIILSALMTGTCVAFSGTIGFIGLVVPYILRLLFRSDYQFILPLSAILGSVILILGDSLSRTLLPPTEIPIGILTALMGGPVFIAILMKFKKSMR